MPNERGRYVNDIASDPEFDRIRREIHEIVDYRSKESQAAFAGLMNFCGVVYTGSTIAILGFIGTQVSRGVPVFAIFAFGCFAAALVSFAVCYQAHSQLMARRYERYAVAAQGFFARKTSLEDLIELNYEDGSKHLYRTIFWLPLTLATLGFAIGISSVVGLGPLMAPTSVAQAYNEADMNK